MNVGSRKAATNSVRITLIIPTLNGGRTLPRLLDAVEQQSRRFDTVIAVDSSSSDSTPEILAERGITTITIPRREFRHGATRNLAAEKAGGDILVFLTQDAVPAHPEWLAELIAPLLTGRAEAAYARQLPHPHATPLERFARMTNYPADGRTVSREDIARLGIRAFFFSNSCSAVRGEVFEALGGFPDHTIMNEDMLFAARLLGAGYRISYAADARVYHSHDLSLAKTFRRYFDIGVVFAQAEEELRGVPVAREGMRYALALPGFLAANGWYCWLPRAVVESGIKWSGSFLGRRYRSLPPEVVRRLSLHPAYWGEVGS